MPFLDCVEIVVKKKPYDKDTLPVDDDKSYSDHSDEDSAELSDVSLEDELTKQKRGTRKRYPESRPKCESLGR
jgi:hypothetical protein